MVHDSVGILLGTSSWRFRSHRIIFNWIDDSAPYWVAVGNYNNDTYLDIVVSNSGTDNIIILLGDGTGSFSNWRVSHPTGTPISSISSHR